MRLDKFLKNSRLIKRRTIAKEACDNGRILINEIVAKAGTKVKVGDTISIKLGEKLLRAKVTALLDHVTKDDAEKMYEII
ncbi:RNA-binding S4 domain-containing protein [Alkalibaculum sp. M08DMB]|uniref:RQC P-site tRNA stabilizing factor n=1 Tax=Alkalibaculum sporogenes TaxID=2655001 RepID=A0A6A7K6H0_9FIRM|nr:RNA-binding S4 domain-containing protein [Alkalibaculum sporogenes]MPW24965.1 RNA-binding S4 domain-containing protein [Alkalibaculum sporogenes]